MACGRLGSSLFCMVEDEPDDGRRCPEAVGMMVAAWLQDHFYLSMHLLVPLGKNRQVLFVWNSRVTVSSDPDDRYLCFSIAFLSLNLKSCLS
ncbi:MAG: hypothetical protein LKJ95_00155 [Bacteroidales bacterium]|jgi:hypothetical protein|nr:hypothetical protein [Bacteroidales bacterium]